MIYTFRIQINNITKPPVWREVSVPAQFTFEQFHLVIQEAFGWYNCHLYQFSEQGYGSSFIISVPSEDDWTEVKDSKKIKLNKIFHSINQKYVYIYDFGDDWIHKITLKEISKENSLVATLLKAKGACPPEDCGGPWGYQNLLKIINDPKHPEYEEMRDRLCLEEEETWDTEDCDIDCPCVLVSSVSWER